VLAGPNRLFVLVVIEKFNETEQRNDTENINEDKP
jgi:hypothetical protein